MISKGLKFLGLDSLFAETVSPTGKYSEKRVTRVFVILCLMLMTMINFFTHNFEIQIEVFISWMGFAGYDGYRIYQEKKLDRTQPIKEEGS